MATTQQRSSSPLRNKNEYFENARMLDEFDGVSPRRAFSNAVTAYARSVDQNKRVRLIEAVIRTARGVATDTSLLGSEDRQSIDLISRHYAAFAPTNVNSAPQTYSEARELLRSLFF